MRWLLLVGVVGTLGCAPKAAVLSSEVAMTTARHGDECLVTVGGEEFQLPQQDSILVKHLRALRDRAIVLKFEGDTPYRCIGSAILALQKVDAKFRVPQLHSQ